MWLIVRLLNHLVVTDCGQHISFNCSHRLCMHLLDYTLHMMATGMTALCVCLDIVYSAIVVLTALPLTRISGWHKLVGTQQAVTIDLHLLHSTGANQLVLHALFITS